MRFYIFLCFWKGEDKFGSDPLRADDIYIFTVQLYGLFYDRKAKPGALFVLSP